MKNSAIWLILVLYVLSARCLADSTKPNLILLLADDMGYGDAGFTGHPTILTPNLDELASKGITLRQLGMNDVLPCDAIGGLPQNETTIAETLSSAGYATALIGKWHLGQQPEFAPTRNGFDYHFGIPYAVDQGCVRNYSPYPCPENITVLCPTPLPLYENETIVQQPVDLQSLSQHYAEKATSWLAAKTDKPFFLMMAFSHMHVAQPSGYMNQSIQWCGPAFEDASRRGMYGDAVAEMDWVVGQIVSQVRKLGIEDNTVIFFASDNGPWLVEGMNGGSAGLFYEGKGSTFEGGIRSPGFIYWHNKIAPRTALMPAVSLMDFYPTMAELAGATLPSVPIDGVSLVPALFQNASIVHDVFYFYNMLHAGNHTICAVRNGPYKVHFITRTAYYSVPPVFHDPPLVFNVEYDPSERLSMPPSYPTYADIVSYVNASASFTPGINQLGLGEDPTLAPCCNPVTNCVCDTLTSTSVYHISV